MNINTSPVKYSSIVEIGESVSQLEKENKTSYLKLHRGVMDVDLIDIDTVIKKANFNSKLIQQYGGNDGDSDLINTIRDVFDLTNHKVMVAPGGMATLDLVINSLSDDMFYVPNYHWGSWNKILTIHNKKIESFNDFDLKSFKPESGVVMLCYPSNPTGWCPSKEELKEFIDYCYLKNITVILDLPYYFLFNDNNSISEILKDNVILLSSFSKSFGLSGLRVGFIATTNIELYNTLRIRSLYKYNSISTISQFVINMLLTDDCGKVSLQDYKYKTTSHIALNIQYLRDNGLLFDEYPTTPIGPFAIVNKTFNELMKCNISSVPLDKFTVVKNENHKRYSRISVAVNHEIFKKYFDMVEKIDISNEQKITTKR
jgi:aspartate/methionine/tyrosine aminotransferase